MDKNLAESLRLPMSLVGAAAAGRESCAINGHLGIFDFVCLSTVSSHRPEEEKRAWSIATMLFAAVSRLLSLVCLPPGTLQNFDTRLSEAVGRWRGRCGW